MVLLDDEMHIYVWNLNTNITVTEIGRPNPAYDVRISIPLYFLPTSITPLQTIISGDHPHPNPPLPLALALPSPTACPNLTATLITDPTTHGNNPHLQQPKPLGRMFGCCEVVVYTWVAGQGVV